MFDDYSSIKIFYEIHMLISEANILVQDSRHFEIQKKKRYDSKLIEDDPGKGS